MNNNRVVLGNINSSEIEIRDLIKSWIAISLAFGIIISRSMDISFYLSFIISSLTVGTGFIFHELSHKLVAQRYGCFAEFRSSDMMLIFAVFLALILGIVFAAPGAVMISGPVGRRRNGIISLAGPLVNIILAIIFLLLLLSIPLFQPVLFLIGFFVNSLIAMFNLLPIVNFDGKKVLNWNKTVYFIVMGVSIVLFFLSSQMML